MTFTYSLPINSKTRNVTKLPERFNEEVYRDAPESEEPGSEEPGRDNRRVYYFTIPIDCLSPNPTSLVGMVEKEELGVEKTKAFNIFVLFATLLRMIEEMMYTRGTSDCGMAKPKAGEGMRLFMEYLVDRDVAGVVNNLDDVQLLECIGVRFALVVFGDQYDLTHALEKHFEAIKKQKGPNKKSKDVPKMVRCGANEIKSWSVYKSFASAYSGKFCDDNTDEQPASGSQLSVNKLFSLQMAEEVAERSTREVAQLQKGKFFGIPELSYEISLRLASRMVLLYVALPRMQHFKEMNEQDQIQVYALLGTMQDPTSTAASTLLQNRKLANAKCDDLMEIKELLAKRMRRVDAIEDLKMRAVALNQHRRFAARLHQRIFTKAAAISEPSRLIAAYVTKEQKTWSTQPADQTVIDRCLTSFGNMIAADFYDLESVMGVSTTHAIAHIALVCAFNAHQYKLGALHLNLLLLGTGSSGKSFILDLVKMLLVEGVATKIAHMTEKALTTGENNNDHISMFHEIPASLIGTDGRQNGAETGNTILKDALTSGTVETQTIVITEDGKRVRRNYKSERSGVIIGASNEREDKMSQSMRTRFLCVPVNEYERIGHTVTDKKRGSMDLTDKDASRDKQKRKRLFAMRIRRRLCMVHMVERLIATGTIEEPDLSIAKLCVQKCMDYIKEKMYPGTQYNQRDYDFVVTYARTLTLMHACERYANDAESPGLDREFTFKNLLSPPGGGRGIMRYMICTQEIAVYSLSVFFKQLIRYNTILVTELLLFAFSRETDSRELIVGNDGRTYVSSQRFFTDEAIYDCAENAQRNRRTVAEVLSRENIIVAWNALLSSVKGPDHAPAVNWNKQDGSVTFDRAYVDRHFSFNRRNKVYKPKSLLNIFKHVLEKGFLNPYQKGCEYAMTSFPFVQDKPFVLTTIRIKEGDKTKKMYIEDPSFDMRSAMLDGTPDSHSLADGNFGPNGKKVRKSLGGRVLYCDGVMEVSDDLQDLLYNRRELIARADGLNVPEDEVVSLLPDDDNGGDNNSGNNNNNSDNDGNDNNDDAVGNINNDDNNNNGEDDNQHDIQREVQEQGDNNIEEDVTAGAQVALCAGFDYEDSRKHLDKVHLRDGTEVMFGMGSTEPERHYPHAMRDMHDKAYDSKVFKKVRLG
ncbi:Hypothetical Protein FCC1311_098022 [Hondaea fermentalgiana]|uniref:Helicase n=1 Tax=Hondaea fermentalgiana TaxID=2315210 RepID=A0A2R5GTC6_9STRA|nr:Hypothetical Protein FCC1311_098022 [Hondaea fermentalgiana]|eukprot:GBG33579.1 Hypothetical Protein FCC1311_098022 [Hondaea fermentalgiana]